MPINIDGTDISSATIDGENVSEITIDGQTVFTSIPDSAIHQWKFDEGAGTTVADSIGSADGSVSGPAWVSGEYIGDNALNGDGTDDIVETTTLGSFGSNLGTGWSVALTVENAGAGRFAVVNSSDRTLCEVSIGARNAGSLRLVLRRADANTDGDSLDIETTGGHLNDGNKHRAVWVSRDPSISGTEFWVDGSEVTGRTTEIDDLSGSTFSNFEYPWLWFARNNDGSPDAHFDGIIDEPMMFDSGLSSSEIQSDYDRQPWS